MNPKICIGNIWKAEMTTTMNNYIKSVQANAAARRKRKRALTIEVSNLHLSDLVLSLCSCLHHTIQCSANAMGSVEYTSMTVGCHWMNPKNLY